MQNYFGYIRVSTVKQGEKGVSLQEQKDAIDAYSRRFGLTIERWFDERETAAKRGRPVFTQMLKLLRAGKARGVIIHKIDRSARNLKDWADLGEMIDAGIEVHFANESLDLHSRGGRLSADIQAVVSADYIRNLREETKKGFYGRLKQGFYPLRAPIGYLDQGKAKPKIADLERAPLVIQSFKLYATGEYSLDRLLQEITSRGLRNRKGGRLSVEGLSIMLNNPFYTGLIRIRKRGEVFEGNHEPLIPKSLFDQVQAILRGKSVKGTTKHEFTYRRMIRCASCKYSLVGERQKGHVYYRCQTKNCPTKTIREENIEDVVTRTFAGLFLNDAELKEAEQWFQAAEVTSGAIRASEIEKCKTRIAQIRPRLSRLMDAFLEGMLERELFAERKEMLLREEQELKEKLKTLENGSDGLAHVKKFLELAKSAKNSYELAAPDQKRQLIKQLTSNLIAIRKNVALTLKPETELLFKRKDFDYCSPNAGTPRTLHSVLDKLLDAVHNKSESFQGMAETSEDLS